MLQVRDLHKRYGDVVALRGVSLDVPPGKVVGFLGPNGAGKSTTMRSIFGLVAPDQGTITWAGAPIDGDSLTRFGYMPEQRGLYPKMKIGQQVSYFGQLKGMRTAEANAKAAALLGDLGLGDRLDDAVEKLSHGNQQRVQLAVALVHDPELLVLDEPFSGLDPVAVGVLQDVLLQRARQGAGVLFSSHQLDLVERLCDHVVIIANGGVRADGDLDELRADIDRRTLDIRVDRPLEPLHQVLAGFDLIEADTRTATVLIHDDNDLDRVLATARTAGEVSTFRFEPPSLTEVFEKAVANEEGTKEGQR